MTLGITSGLGKVRDQLGLGKGLLLSNANAGDSGQVVQGRRGLALKLPPMTGKGYSMPPMDKG